MAIVHLGIGSNIDRVRHIKAGLSALDRLFAPLAISPVYESEAVGFGGDRFYNLVVRLETDETVANLSLLIKRIEDENGRRRDGPRFASRTLDIDILTYDDVVGVIDGIKLPRDEITENAFVLLPLSRIAGNEVHPVLGVPYQQLWDAYDKGSQPLWEVDFDWNQQSASSIIGQ